MAITANEPIDITTARSAIARRRPEILRRLRQTHLDAHCRSEQDLMALAARTGWVDLSHRLIYHGRHVCSARKPDCPGGVLRDLCPSGSREYAEKGE